jgi:hypothetical protein
VDQLKGIMQDIRVPSGKHTKNYGKSPFLMGNSTISMAIFNSKLLIYQRVNLITTGSPLLDLSLEKNGGQGN